jgi:hypothetical protein
LVLETIVGRKSLRILLVIVSGKYLNETFRQVTIYFVVVNSDRSESFFLIFMAGLRMD